MAHAHTWSWPCHTTICNRHTRLQSNDTNAMQNTTRPTQQACLLHAGSCCLSYFAHRFMLACHGKEEFMHTLTRSQLVHHSGKHSKARTTSRPLALRFTLLVKSPIHRCLHTLTHSQLVQRLVKLTSAHNKHASCTPVNCTH